MCRSSGSSRRRAAGRSGKPRPRRRRGGLRGRSSALGSLLDPIADKVLVLGTLVMLVGLRVVPAWMVATIMVREVLITGLRQAAIERGVVLAARDLGKLKTWAQAVAGGLGGFAAAGARSERVAWWGLLVAVVPTSA